MMETNNMVDPPLSPTSTMDITEVVEDDMLLSDYFKISSDITRGKHILVLGADNGIGFHVVRQALAVSYHVTVLVESDSNLPFPDSNLRNPNFVVHVGSVLSRKALDHAVDDQDAVINCLGSRSSWWGDTGACSRVQSVINESMQAKNVNRLIIVSRSKKCDIPQAVRNVIPKVFSDKTTNDKENQEKLVKESGLEWSIIRFGKASNGKLTGRYRIGESSVTKKISRADIAHFLLYELMTNKWLFKTTDLNGYD